MRLDKGSYDPSGVRALADSLKTNTVLLSLNLAGAQGDASSGIGPEAVIALCKALGSNRSLRDLHLQHNTNLGVQGIEALAKLLGHNATLRSLNLASTRLGATEYTPLVTARAHPHAVPPSSSVAPCAMPPPTL